MLIIPDLSGALLRVVTTTTADIDSSVSFTDHTIAGDVMLSDQVVTLIVTATTTTICAKGAASTRRNVKQITLRNDHASTSNVVTAELFNGTNAATLFKVTLAAGEVALMNDAGTWFVYDANGAVKSGTGTGRLIKSTILTSGTSFTTQAGVQKIRIRVQGGGGGGGGCTSVAAAGAGAGGGGGGGYAEKEFAVTPNTAYAYTIGGAGAGNSAAAGGNGGNSTFVVGATTVTAFGGTGGPQAVTGTALKTYLGGAGGVVSTNGDMNGGGEPGQPGACIVIAGPIVFSGNGGASVFGGGGIGRITAGTGGAATGFGAGGGGSATGASAAATGGAGTAGCIEVDEYS